MKRMTLQRLLMLLECVCYLLAGASYMEVHAAGGGINFTVQKTTAASADELYTSLEQRLKRMVASGSTTVEAKSGYGLKLPTELKMLRVLTRAERDMKAPRLCITYCGAHSLPEGETSEEATKRVVERDLPELERQRREGAVRVDQADVFCEGGVFSAEQTTRILTAAAAQGLAGNFHGDELSNTHAGLVGARCGARSISHLEEADPESVAVMAAQEPPIHGVLLPTTAYLLRLRPPPAREMIQAGVPVALGSDFNPNAYCISMPMVMHLACVLFRMSMDEALSAATINAASSLGLSHLVGSLEAGKKADILVVNSDRWENIIYQFGEASSLLAYVIKDGLVVASYGQSL